MMQFITPLVIVVIAGVLFFAFTDPLMDQIQLLRVEEARLNEALENAKELRRVQENLLATYRAFAPEDLERLNKLLPDNVDNVRLIIDINNVARPYNMALRNVVVGDNAESGASAAATPGQGASDLGAISLSFSVSGPYNNFKSFLADLAKSLRLVELRSITFTAGERDFTNYQLELQTYWLK